MQREKMVYMAVKDSSQEDEDISKHNKKHFWFSRSFVQQYKHHVQGLL